MVSEETAIYNMSRCWDNYYDRLGAEKRKVVVQPRAVSRLWSDYGEKLRSWWFDLMAEAKIEEVKRSRKMLFCPGRVSVDPYALLFRFGVLQPAPPHLTKEQVAILAMGGGVMGRIKLGSDAKVLEVSKQGWKRRRGLLGRIINSISGGRMFGI